MALTVSNLCITVFVLFLDGVDKFRQLTGDMTAYKIDDQRAPVRHDLTCDIMRRVIDEYDFTQSCQISNNSKRSYE